MKIRCPRCGLEGEVSNALAGKRIICRRCSTSMILPIVEAEGCSNSVGKANADGRVNINAGKHDAVTSSATEHAIETIPYQCSCGKRYSLPAYFAGRKVRCKTCGKKGRVAGSRPSSLPRHAGKVTAQIEECVCPHCWKKFAVEDLFSIARHEELLGDPVLGPDIPQRFKPERFTPEGYALDAKGFPCPDLACPHCHLDIPLALTEIEPTFLSVVGAPASGKSYFLTAATWEIRRLMSQRFAFSFSDADTFSNQVLQQYEETLFLNPGPESYVRIEKTQTEGTLYDQINLDGQVIQLPRPFMFTLRPVGHNPAHGKKSAELSRVLIVYDNAGEHFQPGTDTVANPVTQHLTRSSAIIFLFDPAQDVNFRRRCKSADPQLKSTFRVSRQEILLNETTQRVRRYTSLRQTSRYDKPLLIVVGKYDIWKELLDHPAKAEPWSQDTQTGAWRLDVEMVKDVSDRIRELLREICPELVSTAESFSAHVRYFPVSALGHSPSEHPANGGLVVRPHDIKPTWAAIPFVYLFAEWSLIGKT